MLCNDVFWNTCKFTERKQFVLCTLIGCFSLQQVQYLASLWVDIIRQLFPAKMSIQSGWFGDAFIVIGSHWQLEFNTWSCVYIESYPVVKAVFDRSSRYKKDGCPMPLPADTVLLSSVLHTWPGERKNGWKIFWKYAWFGRSGLLQFERFGWKKVRREDGYVFLGVFAVCTTCHCLPLYTSTTRIEVEYKDCHGWLEKMELENAWSDVYLLLCLDKWPVIFVFCTWVLYKRLVRRTMEDSLASFIVNK